jgi:predicted GNAT family N-acyltransferase
VVFKIEPLDSRKHLRPEFSCGKESLDNYIRQQASQDLKRQVATVFVLINAPDTAVLGYYTLSAFTVDITQLDTAFAKKLPRYPRLPATLLDRLAIDQNQKGQRLGELLLIDALKRSLNASNQVASLAVIAEAIDKDAVNFYTKYGFQPFQENPMKLYLPMSSIEKLCQALCL